MRDRLIELLCSAPLGSKTFEQQYYKGTITKIADYLLANGVIVLPCNLGDKIYDAREFIYNIDCPELYEMQSNEITVEKGKSGRISFTYDGIYLYHGDIGKTVFLTREEAEQALKGGDEND